VVQAGWLVGLLFLVRLGGFSLTNRAAAVR